MKSQPKFSKQPPFNNGRLASLVAREQKESRLAFGGKDMEYLNPWFSILETPEAIKKKRKRRKKKPQTTTNDWNQLGAFDQSENSRYQDYQEMLYRRFLEAGHKYMLDHELLEMLLDGAIPLVEIAPTAKKLLNVFGDLNGVLAASKHMILKIDGVTPQVYLSLHLANAIAHRMWRGKVLKREVVSCWKDLIKYCRISMAHRETEQFRIFFLDNKNAVISDEEQAIGTVDHVTVYPREIVKRALELNAIALILVHNHPSGDPTPSQQDILMTQKISCACETIGVTVHDHVIIGKGSEVSFRSEGYF